MALAGLASCGLPMTFSAAAVMKSTRRAPLRLVQKVLPWSVVASYHGIQRENSLKKLEDTARMLRAYVNKKSASSALVGALIIKLALQAPWLALCRL